MMASNSSCVSTIALLSDESGSAVMQSAEIGSGSSSPTTMGPLTPAGATWMWAATGASPSPKAVRT
jgi:hypothetical protein